MKKIYVFLMLFLALFSLSGCIAFDLGPSDPIDTVDNTPTTVIISNPSNKSIINVGEAIDLNASVAPETAVQTVTWSSNDQTIASVNQNGLVLGLKEGSVKITATSTGANVSGYIYLTIKKEVNITAIEIVEINQIHVEETVKLEVIKTPTDATNTFTWVSSDPNIATIDINGRVTGKTVGSVLITVTSGSLSDSITVNVIERSGTPTSLAINGRNTINVAGTTKLVVQVLPIGSINTVIWESNNTEVATVSSDGVVTGIATGIVSIKAISTLDATVFNFFEIEVLNTEINQDNLQQNIIDVIANTKNSILGVSNYTRDLTNNTLQLSSIGSGAVYKVWFELYDGSIIYDEKELISFNDVKTYHYYLMTNRHVVLGNDALKIYLHQEDKEVNAVLKQYDDKVDLAVVYFTYDKYIKPLELTDSNSLQAGEFAIAIGNPSGYEFSSSATFGIISYPKRYISDDTDGDGVNDWDAEYIQHDVAINPGNSGGPLLNLKGQIIGMNTLKFAATEIDSMGFSIPSNVIKDLLPILEVGEKPKRALLGVQIMMVKDLLKNPNPLYVVPENVTYGAYVVDVNPTGVAGIAGILKDDIIINFNGVDITSSIIVRTELGKIVVGSNQEVIVQVLRNNQIISLTLIF